MRWQHGKSAWVRVTIEDGAFGWGEISPMFGGNAALELVKSLASRLVGQNALDSRVLHDRLFYDAIKTGPDGALAAVLATYVPPFPIYPPETAWFQAPQNPLPAIFAHQFGKGRAVYSAADIDRCFARDALPDHARVLANAVRFVAQSAMTIEVSGAGLLDCHLFRQENRLILHLVNEQNGAPSPLHELVGVGPFEIKIRRDVMPETSLSSARFLSDEKFQPIRESGDWWEFSVAKIEDHEVIVLSEN